MALNQISEGLERISEPDQDGEIQRKPPSPLLQLEWQIVVRSAEAMYEKAPTNRVETSTVGRSELREAVQLEVKAGTIASQEWERFKKDDTNAKQWAGIDADEYTSSRSPKKRSELLEAIAGNMRNVPEYAEALKVRAPKLADKADEFNKNLAKIEEDRVAESHQAKLAAENVERRDRLEKIADERAANAVQALRKEQTEAVARELGLGAASERDAVAPGAAVKGRQAPDEPAASKPAPDKDGRDKQPTEPARPEATAEPTLLRRPITPEEVSEELKRRYVVASEGRSVLEKGVTEFAIRGGERDGAVAFVDKGKQLASGLEDRDTVQSMVEVAKLKGWKEIHVDGSDYFKRSAWVEAKLSGLEVTGYEPKEADKIRLAELLEQRTERNNTITAGQSRQSTKDQEQQAQQERPAAKGKESRSEPRVPQGRESLHVDGDSLSQKERTVLEPLKEMLVKRQYTTEFIDATMVELERRMRAHRTHVGELLEHGPAPYKFEQGKAESYFARLRTPEGEVHVWGKKIGEAIEQGKVRVGDQIVLSNIGDKPVQVLDRSGKQPEWKDTKLNSWTAQAIDRLREPDAEAARARAARSTPTLLVADPRAPRVERDKPARAAQEHDRSERDQSARSRGDKER